MLDCRLGSIECILCVLGAVPQVQFESGMARLPNPDQVNQHDVCSFSIPGPKYQGCGTSRYSTDRLYVHLHAEAATGQILHRQG